MLHRNVFKTFQYPAIVQKRNSALFVNGIKASEQFVYVTPHIDVPDLLKNKDNVQDNLNKRKSNVNLNKIKSLWTVYEELRCKKLEYESKKNDISKEYGKLVKSESSSELTKKLKMQIDLLKDNIKKLKVPLWSAEEAVFIEALQVPNKLHSRTPSDTVNVIFTHLSAPKNANSHLKIAEDLKLVKYKNNENYYLTGDAALFELGAKFHVSSVLKKNNFIQFSNPDFVKSVIVEGCGINHTDPDSTYILHHNEETKVNKDSRLHLTGGASLCSFLAYHTKNVLYPKVLPLKYFTMGRQYTPKSNKSNNLFNVSQSSVVEVFCVTKTESSSELLQEELVDIMKDIFLELGCHFRIIAVPAPSLGFWESMKIAVEMYSTSTQSYIEVGSLSLSNNFISKRLMFTYVENKENQYPHILSGTIINVPKLLACILEQDTKFVIPESFKVERWVL